jgi:Mrp family chromosome partitioning ATPase/uncharacterized protein involved in exopolysaccharide biosynthesis
MTEELPLPGRGIKPLASLLAHRKLALGTFLVVLIVGAPIAWKKGVSHYVAESTIQVAPRYMRNLKEDQELDFQSNTQYRQFVENQRKSVGRYDVLRDALASLGDKRFLWQKPDETERRAVERLRDGIQAVAVPDSYQMRLTLEGESPKGLAEVVNAVTTVFMERMKSEQIYGSDERARNLRAREKELVTLIAAKGGQRSEIAQKLSLTTFNEGTPNPYDHLVVELRSKLSDASLRRMEADGALAAFSARGDTTVAVRSVQDAVLNDPGLNSLKGALSTRRAALLVQKSGLRADHPGALAADRELAEIDSEIQRETAKMEGGTRGNLLARLQGTADQARAVEKGLLAEASQLESQATGYARLFQDAMSITSDIGQARSELDKVRERINYIEVESTSFGFLRLVTPALEPDLPFGPGRKKLLLMTLAAALAAAIVAPILRDLLDRRVHTVNDAQRLMGIVPAGWQVRLSDAASHVFGDEQLRRMAAALLRSRQTSGRHVFGFSGCKAGAGTTSLVLELGFTLRQLGYSVLAVEANGYSRDARYASNRPGLTELLQGSASAAEVVAEETAELPPRVSVGGQGRVSLGRIDRLGKDLNDWAAHTDFVLVDLPPLLVSADAELLVPVVGQVLLVIEAGAVTKGEVLRARRLLQTIDPQAVGLVVNGIAPFVGGGYLSKLMAESASGVRTGSLPTEPVWKQWLGRIGARFKKASK